MEGGSPNPGSRRTAMIFGFVLLGLGCTMAIAGASIGTMPMAQRIILVGIGLFGAYWGLRFQRLSRRGQDS